MASYEFHLKSNCGQRLLKCPNECNPDALYPAQEIEMHLANCLVPCDMCHTVKLPKEKIEDHKNTDCPRAMIACKCSAVYARESKEDHDCIEH